MVQCYKDQYRHSMEGDIKKVLEHGTVVHILHLLLNTRAQYDAELIQSFVEDWNPKDVAEIICCRTVEQLRVYTGDYIYHVSVRAIIFVIF